MATHRFNGILFLLCVFCLLTFTASADSNWHGKRPKGIQNWLNHGGDLRNRRYANKETKISPTTVSKLSLKWKFYAGKDITATPAIFNGTLYFPSWNGYIYAIKESDGSLVWEKNLQELTGLNATGFVPKVNWTVSRSTPTIADDLLIIGIYGPAVVIAVERSTGKLVWSTQLDSHAAGLITMSGTYYKGGFYVGTSSLEEALSVEQCCTFRGSFSKLDVRYGTVLWQTFMLPDNYGKLGGYAGAAIWGSSPSIDIPRKHVYIATGNLYSVPLNEAGPGGLSGGGSWGSATDNKRVYTNIINSDGMNFTLKPSQATTKAGGWVAMNAHSGEILWSTADPSNATASGPVTVANHVLFAGSTNPKGPIYALNAKTGDILWSYETGATVFGGMSVSDGCVYVGNGYSLGLGSFSPSYTAGTSLYAFCLK